MTIIQVNHLVREFNQYKRFKGFFGAFRSLVTKQKTIVRAVDDISFTVEKGEAVGYLGPNGAGKSTMIKMLTGILVPTSGQIVVNGAVPYKNRRSLSQHIGVVFGQRGQLWWDLPAIDSFELHRHIYKIPQQRYEHNVSFCTELLEMKDFITRPVRQLSLGQRMRAEISLALLHEPDILFLDEPTIGLDVMAKDRIREFLRAVNKERKMTIILTSHDMKDIEEICGRILVVSNGKNVYDGTVKDLKSHVSVQRKITIEFAQDPGDITLDGTECIEDQGRIKKYKIQRDSTSTFQMLAALSDKVPIVDVVMEDADIEDVIRTLYRNINEENERMKEREPLLANNL